MSLREVHCALVYVLVLLRELSSYSVVVQNQLKPVPPVGTTPLGGPVGGGGRTHIPTTPTKEKNQQPSQSQSQDLEPKPRNRTEGGEGPGAGTLAMSELPRMTDLCTH